ncbi:aldehyde dehydrogenase [Paludicola sp. MB14-C6]|uniref:aldehyde dehydrogenase n=1 Tax=Paludihabitans sp. MB14-C6 TaxID=3070656 RepID=UPI0027DD1255|nr:aldehyde dehydrogenase [Paludicola sp. MB14-C6]WMJ22152.1 aldehyde dehydrogenase [Paludicola sp. MB14-C6]
MNIDTIVQKQREFFNSNATKSVSFRKTQLQKLEHTIKSNEQAIYDALKEDLNKSEYETYLTEVSMVLSEIHTALKHIDRWVKPNKKPTSLANFPAKSYTIHEPYGVALILSPWNYPFQLALAPVVGAIAAGNCVVLKCSKNSEHTSEIIAKMISENFDSKFIYCVNTRESYDEILAQKYDYIFFTGSERVGKIVMRAASNHVTPISLELGGKSPCFVDNSADIDLAAKRIIWGKLLNSGQTCVAPDYVLVDAKVKDQLIAKMQEQITIMYQNPLMNQDYPKIISKDHFERLTGLIQREEHKLGGASDEALNKIAPAIFTKATFDSEIMKEEIFGPILPIISYTNLDEVITTVKGRAKPLACYIFAQEKAYSDKIVHEVSFGGGCINDTVMHLVNHNLPFGGVGSSGMGGYHGKYSFDTFSHEKSVLKNKTIFDVPLRYAPYQMKNLPTIKKIMK